MHFKGIISLCGAIVAAIALVSVSGATTAKSHKIGGIDVSSRASLVHYLRSIHVNPKGMVVQRGVRNYAGPSCPGRGWRCARTRHTVVQIARRGGLNRFRCSTGRCAVVQIAAASAKNKGVCIKITGLVQSCTINQSGPGPNTAVVYENTLKQSGLTQSASYTASITQLATGTDTSNSNTACVTQNVTIDGSTTAPRGRPVTVTLEAHQSVTIRQDVLGLGANSAQYGADATGNCLTSQLAQNQTLTSTANGSGPITQNENDALSACGDGVPGDNANMCLDIEQNQGSGKHVAGGPNNATFTQTNTLTAIANTSTGPVTQTQSSICPSPAGGCVVPGGLVGTVNQDSAGLSTASATQTETQCEDALQALSGLTTCDTQDPDASEAPPSLTQTQYGPVGVFKLRNRHPGRQPYGHLKGLGTSTQTGNEGCSPSCNSFAISQTSTQDNDQGSGSTQKNTGQADCSTSGNCNANQSTTVNGQTTNNARSGQNVSAQTTCSGSVCSTATGIFVSVGNGLVQEWSPGGALVRTLDTGKGAGVFTTGLAFDSTGKLYVTDFNANDVTKFNADGSLAGSFGSGYNADPESIVFDGSGSAYVGQADGSHQVLKFDSSGAPVTSFSPATEDRGTDWIDLAPDQCTLYYTSEGTSVKRFNVCSIMQLPDLATGLPGAAAFAIKVLPDGGALVADSASIVRLNSSGNVVQQYGTGEPGAWFSLALDPSGTVFWAGDVFTGDVKEFDLASGNVLTSFNTGSAPGAAAGGLAAAH